MLSAKQRYRDISPVALEVAGGVVSASLYCGEVEGLPAHLVDSFLAELYRCKLCQFTCGLKASISSHLQLQHHRPPAALAFPEEGGGAKDREAEPYQLDLNEGSKPSEEDEDFLLYDMLDNMSPPSCDISGEGGLQVAHTCEVSTLFEEEASIFPLKEASERPPPSQEDVAQSAHLRTLGLCRISTAKASPRSSAPPPVQLPPDGSPKRSRRTASRRPRLLCFLCPLELPSRRLLDVHVRSHQAAGGFSCLSCSWGADSWEEMEPHWRSHWRRKEHKDEKKKKKRRSSRKQLERKTESTALQTQQTPETCTQEPRSRLIGQEEAEQAGRLGRRTGMVSLENLSQKTAEVRLSCSVCHRKFSSQLTLRRHMGVHGGDKPFSCPHCSYRSRLKASLLQHLRTHTGEKPYRCPECVYASIDRSSLLRHYRTHSQEKPYRCGQCSYSSIQKKSLDLHARRHHTGEAFPCQQCEYSSPDRQLLLRHVRTRHAPPQHAAP